MIACTVGAGLSVPQGRRVEFDASPTRTSAIVEFLRTLPSTFEAWWSCSTFQGDYRSTDNWRAADLAGVDVDYADSEGEHEELPSHIAEKLHLAAERGDLPGNVFHLTPRGFRLITVLN